MTEANVNLYEKLYDEFYETCEHIAQILNEYEYFRQFNILDAEKYTLQTDDVWYDGIDKYDNIISGSFDRKYLTMTDSQIRHAAKQKNDEFLESRRRRVESWEKEQKENEYQKYLELKQKFENS